MSDYNTMTSADVIDIYSTLGGLGIQIWIDGGRPAALIEMSQ